MKHKQKTFQSTPPSWVEGALCAALCGFGIAAGVETSQAQSAGLGSGAQMTTLRLVAAAGLKDGKYDAGVDIAMAPGSHTYWKNPGEAGVPPVFTFNGSENVKQADVLFPAPARISEDGIDAFGYSGQVVFPVAVTPADASKPSTLHVVVAYAVCNKICVPGHGEADLRLDPRGAGDSPALVQAALAAVPRPLADPRALHVAAVTASEPTWTLTWTGQTPIKDIFPDAPDGFYFATKKTGPDVWTLIASQSVATEKVTPVPVKLVLAGATGASETTLTFDVKPSAK